MQGSSYHEPDKSNVLLTELVIVILFFALTAVTVMQVFVAAHQKSRHSALVSKATVVAQDIAEQLSGERQPERVLLQNDYQKGEAQGEYIRQVGDDRSVVRVSEEKTATGVLVISKIEVFSDVETRAQNAKLQQAGADAEDAQPLSNITAMSYCPDGPDDPDADGEVGG